MKLLAKFKFSTVAFRHVEGEGSYGPPTGFTSKFKRDQVGSSDKEDELSINEKSSSSSKATSFDDEVVGNDKALHNPQSNVLPSSSVGDETTGSKRNEVLRGSKSTIEDSQTDDVVGGARSAKDGGNKSKIKSPFCDRNGINDMERKSANSCTGNTAFDLVNQIWKLERVVCKLKAARFGPKVKSIEAKAKP